MNKQNKISVLKPLYTFTFATSNRIYNTLYIRSLQPSSFPPGRENDIIAHKNLFNLRQRLSIIANQTLL